MIKTLQDHTYSISCQGKNESSSHGSSVSCIIHVRSFVFMFSIFIIGLLLMFKDRDVLNSAHSSRQRSVLPDSVHSFPDPSGDFIGLLVECLILCCLVTERHIDVTVPDDGQ